MKSAWIIDAVQRELKQHAERKYAEADRCKVNVRDGDESYKRFHDEEIAEAQIAFMLGSDAALGSQERFLERLAEFKRDVAASPLRVKGIFNQTTFDRAAIRYLEGLEARYTTD